VYVEDGLEITKKNKHTREKEGKESPKQTKLGLLNGNQFARHGFRANNRRKRISERVRDKLPLLTKEAHFILFWVLTPAGNDKTMAKGDKSAQKAEKKAERKAGKKTGDGSDAPTATENEGVDAVTPFWEVEQGTIKVCVR
jgi:hypothetical protein